MSLRYGGIGRAMPADPGDNLVIARLNGAALWLGGPVLYTRTSGEV